VDLVNALTKERVSLLFNIFKIDFCNFFCKKRVLNVSDSYFSYADQICFRVSFDVKVKMAYSFIRKPITELRSVTCHIGSHRVSCYPKRVNAPRFNSSQTGRYSIYLPRRDERLSWAWCWLYTVMVMVPVQVTWYSTSTVAARGRCTRRPPSTSQLFSTRLSWWRCSMRSMLARSTVSATFSMDSTEILSSSASGSAPSSHRYDTSLPPGFVICLPLLHVLMGKKYY